MLDDISNDDKLFVLAMSAIMGAISTPLFFYREIILEQSFELVGMIGFGLIVAIITAISTIRLIRRLRE